MTDFIFDWLIDTMARTEVIDLYFVVSDLIEIPQTAEQIAETASYDALAVSAVRESGPQVKPKRQPLGKLVY